MKVLQRSCSPDLVEVTALRSGQRGTWMRRGETALRKCTTMARTFVVSDVCWRQLVWFQPNISINVEKF